MIGMAFLLWAVPASPEGGHTAWDFKLASKTRLGRFDIQNPTKNLIMESYFRGLLGGDFVSTLTDKHEEDHEFGVINKDFCFFTDCTYGFEKFDGFQSKKKEEQQLLFPINSLSILFKTNFLQACMADLDRFQRIQTERVVLLYEIELHS